jgi:hypothetical protein
MTVRRSEVTGMVTTGSAQIDAERAFARTRRARTRATLARRLRREPASRGQLAVFDADALACGRAPHRRGIREIPLEAIRGTVEPTRATLFDRCFRPAASARRRWERLWIAEQRGEALPPISVVPVGEIYAIRDGHHRVSVARARGAVMIDATVAGAAGQWDAAA